MEKGKDAVIIDFTDVETTELTLIPKGKYPIEVLNAEKRTTSENNEYVALELNIVSGALKNRKLFYNISLQPQSLWNLKRSLIAFGYNENKLDAKIKLSISNLIGKKATAIVVHENFQGEPRARVNRLDKFAKVEKDLEEIETEKEKDLEEIDLDELKKQGKTVKGKLSKTKKDDEDELNFLDED